MAHDGQRLQPVFLLLRKGLAQGLERYLAGGGRKIDTWLNAQRLATVDFSEHSDSFINVNDPVQLRDLEARLLSESGAL